MIRRTRWLFVMGLFACGAPADDATDDDTDDGSGDVPLGTTVTANVDPSGGTLDAGALVLDVPQGALDAATDLSVTPEAMPDGTGHEAVSPLYRFAPEGLVFDSPVDVRIEVPGATDDLLIYWSTPVGGWGRLPDVRREGDVLIATTTHFSTAFVAPPGTETEVFAEPDDEVFDVLFVVDDSCSMIEEQAKLADNLAAFFPPISGTGLDWHIGVVTTDTETNTANGRLREDSGLRWVDPGTQDPAAVLDVLVRAGTDGAFVERPLLATQRALAPTDPAVVSHNAGFHRPEGQLLTVLLTDEDDQSAPALAAADFATWYDGLKADPDDALLLTIAGPMPSGCANADTNAEGGEVLLDATDRVDGTFTSVCETDWTPSLLDTLDLLRATACQPLGAEPDPATIEVFLHPVGTVLPASAWIHDPDANCIALSVSGNQLAGSSDIGVTYVPLVP